MTGQKQEATAQVFGTAEQPWVKAKDNGELKPGNALKEGEPIQAREQGAELYLSCGNDKGIVAYICHKLPCSVKACATEPSDGVEIRSKKPSGGPKWSDVLLAFLIRNPKTLQITGVRGAINEPREAVVRLDGSQLDLTPALDKLADGSYCFRLARAQIGFQGPGLRTVFLEWEKGKRGVVDVPGMGPGLYLVQKGKPSGPSCQATEAEPAWILAVPEADFARYGPEFEKTQASLEDEPDPLPENAALIMERALLSSYAENLLNQGR